MKSKVVSEGFRVGLKGFPVGFKGVSGSFRGDLKGFGEIHGLNMGAEEA